MDRTDTAYDVVLKSLPADLAGKLGQVPLELKHCVQEIHLGVNRPAALFTGKEHFFLSSKGEISKHPPSSFLTLTSREMSDCFKSICSYSIHTHYRDICSGFVTLKGGHRAGLCGSCVYEGEKMTGMRDISAFNIRVARECKGSADYLLPIFERTDGGILLAGIPGSGKTTLLRDLTRQLASGRRGRYYKITVVDERCELAAVYGGVPQTDLGFTCDILDGYPKAQAISMAVRALSPDVIVCDELGQPSEMEAVRQSVNCGVRMVASIHAAHINQLLKRECAVHLLQTGAFEKIIFLKDSRAPGEIERIVDLEELGLC